MRNIFFYLTGYRFCLDIKPQQSDELKGGA
jgi:hypothetical protein